MAIWLLIFGAATVLVRAGLAILSAGAVRPADAAEVLLRSAADAAAAVLAFWAVGACFLFGHNGDLLAFDPNLLMSQSVESAGAEFFHAAVAVVGGAIVTAALVGRSRPSVGTVASAVLGGVVFPVVGHLVWFGRLRSMNVIDYGGATAVLLPAAVFAAVAAAMVGSRPARAADAGVADDAVAGDRLPFVATGAVLLAVGWLAYLTGSVLAHPTEFNPMATPAVAGPAMAVTAMNGALAGLSGLLAGLFYARSRHGRADPYAAYLGLLGGLVSITPGCVAVGNAGAVMIGLVAGVLVPAAAGLMNRQIGLDDPVGLVAAAGIGTVWGTLAAAAFAAGQSTIRHVQLVALQSLLLLVSLAISTLAAAVTFAALRLLGPLRTGQTRAAR